MEFTNRFYCDLLDYSYHRDIRLIKDLSGANNVYIVENKETNTECIIYDFDDDLVFSFLGTEKNKIDISYNLFLFPIKIENNIKLHNGYYFKYLSIERKLNLFIENFPNKNIKIHIIGHSMGGCLARLFYYYLMKNFKIFLENKTYLFDIATPSFSNLKLYNYVKGDFYLNSNDPIRFIPLWLIGYRKPKTLKILKTKKFLNFNYHLPSKYFI